MYFFPRTEVLCLRTTDVIFKITKKYLFQKEKQKGSCVTSEAAFPSKNKGFHDTLQTCSRFFSKNLFKIFWREPLRYFPCTHFQRWTSTLSCLSGTQFVQGWLSCAGNNSLASSPPLSYRFWSVPISIQNQRLCLNKVQVDLSLKIEWGGKKNTHQIFTFFFIWQLHAVTSTMFCLTYLFLTQLQWFKIFLSW